MPDNRTKVDSIHGLLPALYNTRTNPNWKALVEALGNADQDTSDLIEEVRKQFFIKTASRPYLDRLAANNKVSRPRQVGMQDSDFKTYIPVLSYKPKQVKLIIDQLLDIFFFKESTTAFITSQAKSPFFLKNGWELIYNVDEINQERIIFNSADFTDISAATAIEIVSAINRQAQYSYATTYYDSITKNTYIRLFTNTIGSKGSLRIEGGRSNISLRFNGFIETSGNGTDTEWTVTKVGEKVTFAYTGGTNPNVQNVIKGDVIVIDMVGNQGAFTIDEIDLFNNSVTFKNVFATAGVFTQTNDLQVKFLRPNKYVAYTNSKRAITWETSSGEITVEMPSSPPVVKRSLKGSTHINGTFSNMLSRNSDTSLTVENAAGFPNSGTFEIEEVKEIMSRYLTGSENIVVSKKFNGRLSSPVQKYEFTSRTVLSTTGNIVAGSNQITNLASVVGLAIGQTVFMNGIRGDARVIEILGNTVRVNVDATMTLSLEPISFGGNTLTGISPPLPKGPSLNEFALTSLERNGSNTGIGTTGAAHGYEVGELVIISGSAGASQTLNGTWTITDVPNTTTFHFATFGPSTGGPIATPGTARVEREALSNSGSKIIITDSISSNITRIKGSYMWDQKAPFVLSELIAETVDSIQAGTIVRILNVGDNDISPNGGFLVFDFGKNNQEGPVKYLYKPTDNTIAIDPSYQFLYSHPAGSSLVAIRHKGPHQVSTDGRDYAPYVIDPSEVRFIIEELIKSVKSAGIFVNFLVRYPEQLYAAFDVYNSGNIPS